MFFLIRCVFWLSVVFHAMSWPQDQSPQEALQSGALKAAASFAGQVAAAAGQTVEAKLEEGCLKAPEECLTYMARLPQMATVPKPDVLPPKRPARLDEGEAGRMPAGHKALERPASK